MTRLESICQKIVKSYRHTGRKHQEAGEIFVNFEVNDYYMKQLTHELEQMALMRTQETVQDGTESKEPRKDDA